MEVNMKNDAIKYGESLNFINESLEKLTKEYYELLDKENLNLYVYAKLEAIECEIRGRNNGLIPMRGKKI